MRLDGAVTAPIFLEMIHTIHAGDPETAGYHLVNDLRAPSGNLGVEGIGPASPGVRRLGRNRRRRGR